MESISEHGYFVNLHAIEQTRLRGQCRVDFHTDEGLEAGGGLVKISRSIVNVFPRQSVNLTISFQVMNFAVFHSLYLEIRLICRQQQVNKS